MGDNNEFENNDLDLNHNDEIEKDLNEEYMGGCRNCGNPIIEEGYKFELCKECRKTLAKRPIPKKIIFIAIAVLVLLGVSLFKFPSYLNAGVTFEKGERAFKEKKYVTAMNCYESIVSEDSNYKIKIDLMELYYHNSYITEAYNIYESLVGKEMEERPYNKAIKTMEKIEKYYMYNDELYNKLNEIDEDDSEKFFQVVKSQVENDPDEICGASDLIDIYIDKKMFNEAKDIAERIATENPDYSYGKYQLALIYIELGEYEEVSEVADEFFKDNKESIYGYLCKSRVELKKGNNEAGLVLAEEIFDLDPFNSFSTINLALAYHYNDMIEERDKIYNYCVESGFLQEDNEIKAIFSGDYKWQEGE